MTREGGMEVVEANGARIPLIGLGTWDCRGRVCARMVEQALRLGYRHVDTAEMYNNEREVGEGLRASGVRRDDVFVTTKVWQGTLEAPALRRLRPPQGVAGSSGARRIRARHQGKPRQAAALRRRSAADPLAEHAHSA